MALIPILLLLMFAAVGVAVAILFARRNRKAVTEATCGHCGYAVHGLIRRASSFNTSSGFTTGAGCSVTGCTATSNVMDGFFVGSGTTITGCTARGNSDAGMHTGNGCAVAL